MDGPRLIIIIPCRNEAATLGPVVAGARAHGRVIVVDDGSSDGSAELARAKGAQVVAGPQQGYDAAITAGLAAAREAGAMRFVTLDADGEHDPACLAEFTLAFDGGADLICGYRPRPARLGEYALNAYARLAFGPRDILCGMKGFSRPVLDRFWASGEPLMVNTAPVVIWRTAGGSFAEVAVTGEARQDAPRFGRALDANIRLIKTIPQLRALAERERRRGGS